MLTKIKTSYTLTYQPNKMYWYLMSDYLSYYTVFFYRFYNTVTVYDFNNNSQLYLFNQRVPVWNIDTAV